MAFSTETAGQPYNSAELQCSLGLCHDYSGYGPIYYAHSTVAMSEVVIIFSLVVVEVVVVVVVVMDTFRHS